MSTAIYQRRYRKMRAMYGDRTIPATGTIRRIQALIALGWSGQRIADVAGLDQKHLWAIQNRPRGIYVGTAKVIAEVYETLSMTLPPVETKSQRISVARSRALAARRRWAPPLAWDDIDDPREQPKGVEGRAPKRSYVDPVVVAELLAGRTLDATVDEKREALRRWTAGGKSARSLERMHGWKEGRYATRTENVA